MIDHMSIYALDFEKTRSFYKSVFATLGHSIQAEFAVENDQQFPGRKVCAFGSAGKTTFWIIETRQQIAGRHIAFSARDHDAVRGFYNAAIDWGAPDNGAPGLRPEYHDAYYASFVIDPDGNDIEAVCHDG